MAQNPLCRDLSTNAHDALSESLEDAHVKICIYLRLVGKKFLIDDALAVIEHDKDESHSVFLHVRLPRTGRFDWCATLWSVILFLGHIETRFVSPCSNKLR